MNLVGLRKNDISQDGRGKGLVGEVVGHLGLRQGWP